MSPGMVPRSTSVVPPSYLRCTSVSRTEVERRQDGGTTEVIRTYELPVSQRLGRVTLGFQGFEPHAEPGREVAAPGRVEWLESLLFPLDLCVIYNI